jgi:outer membrane protein assembly factor BamB
VKAFVSLISSVLLFVSAFTAASSFHLVQANDGSQASSTDWWPMFGHDLSHTGVSTSNAPATNSTLWSYNTHDWTAHLSVADNFLYVGSYYGSVYCLNAVTGAFVWKYVIPDGSTQDLPPENWVADTPAIARGIVYVGSNNRYLYALNATTGALIWETETGSLSSSPAVLGDLVYIGGYDVYCLNADTGATVWQNWAVQDIRSSPAVVGDRLYVASDNGSIFCLNATDGSLAWNYTTGPEISYYGNLSPPSSPTVVNDLVYVGSKDSNFYCLNATTGALVWKYATVNMITQSAAVVNGLVYFAPMGDDASVNDCLYCLNASTGAPVWINKFGFGSTVSSPAVAGNVVFAGVNETVYGFNATTGAIVWSQNSEAFESSPIVANGLIYVGGGGDGMVYALGRSPGFPYLTFSLFIVTMVLLILLMVLRMRRTRKQKQEQLPTE